jgi:hypothetical protein
MKETKKRIVPAWLIAVVLLLICACGCSHNVVTYSDGVGFETTMRPDTGNFGITFRYGKILSATVRENTEVEMQGDANAGTGKDTTATAAANGAVKVKVGKQITGYYVDALNAGATPKQLKEYTSENKKE